MCHPTPVACRVPTPTRPPPPTRVDSQAEGFPQGPYAPFPSRGFRVGSVVRQFRLSRLVTHGPLGIGRLVVTCPRHPRVTPTRPPAGPLDVTGRERRREGPSATGRGPEPLPGVDTVRRPRQRWRPSHLGSSTPVSPDVPTTSSSSTGPSPYLRSPVPHSLGPSRRRLHDPSYSPMVCEPRRPAPGAVRSKLPPPTSVLDLILAKLYESSVLASHDRSTCSGTPPVVTASPCPLSLSWVPVGVGRCVPGTSLPPRPLEGVRTAGKGR